MERSNATHELAEQLFAQLVASLERVDSAPLTAYLSALQRFHRYSFSNIILILSQCPAATRVAGFHTWRSVNRYVRRGEKGIAILAPLVRRVRNDDDDDKTKTTSSFRHVIYGWRTVYVFALSQTDGDPLPSYTMAETSGDVGPYYDRLVTLVRNLGITLTFADDLGGALGTCRPGHGSIQLLDSLEPPTAFATLSHELAHDLLHRRDDPATPTSKNVREAEAEAVAAIVTEGVGVTHLASARDYIRLYAGSAGDAEGLAWTDSTRRDHHPVRPTGTGHARGRFGRRPLLPHEDSGTVDACHRVPAPRRSILVGYYAATTDGTAGGDHECPQGVSRGRERADVIDVHTVVS